MDPVIEELLKTTNALQLPIYANMVIGILALVVGLFVQRAVSRSDEKFKVRMQLELEGRRKMWEALEKLRAIEQNLFHEVNKIAAGTTGVRERNKLAKSLRKLARESSGRFRPGQFEAVIDLINQLTEEACKLTPQKSVSVPYTKCRKETLQALNDLVSLIWS